jgi:hypothetical protein
MTVTRVQYRERQRLQASDLLAEQAYRLGWVGRHHIGPHQWGVVKGLWLVGQAPRLSARWVVTKGIAIDGYGRELWVANPLEFTVDPYANPPRSWFVVLYYCEAPVSIPPCAPCRPDPAPRIGQYVRLATLASDQFEQIAQEWLDLEAARAAGTVPGQAPWPVLLGILRPSTPSPVDYTLTRYVRHRASLLQSPSRTASLRLGLTGQSDFYHFLLSTSAVTGTATKRLAIDRNGGVHVWKPLVVSGPYASGFVPVSARALLSIKTEMPAGIGRRILLKGRLQDPNDPVLSVTWFDSLGVRINRATRLMEGTHFLDQQLRFVGEHPVTFRLENARGNRVSAVVRPRHKGEQPTLLFQQVEAELTPSRGRLELQGFDPGTQAGAEDTPCDPPGKSTKTPGPAPGAILRLEAGIGHVPGAETRELYTESVPLGDGTPNTVLRISGGALDETDRATRVAFGVRDNDGTQDGGKVWHSLLTMDGGGRIAMPEPETLLDVKHTLYLPPIKPDPADPLAQDLLALAYNAGLRRAGRVFQTGITVEYLSWPASIKDGDDLIYRLKITGGASIIKRCLEIIIGTSGDGAVTLRNLPEFSGALFTSPNEAEVTIKKFHHRAGQVHLIHELLLEDQFKDWALGTTGKFIDVTHNS